MTDNRRFGPSGGYGGEAFVDEVGVKLKEINIREGNRIDAIQTVYLDSKGQRNPQPKHGGNGGNSKTFHLDNDEFINRIWGKYGTRVDSLRIITNKKESEKFGGNGGDADYDFRAPEGEEIIGFLGRSGNSLDAIGVITRKRT